MRQNYELERVDMKLALLGAASSIHTIRWANAFVSRGIDVHLITQHDPLSGLDNRVVVHRLPISVKAGYILNAFHARRILAKLQPDIVNAQDASGYGTLAMLCGVGPLLLSVWGSDVYDFPNKTPVHHWLIAKNLKAADAIGSTSNAMARVVERIHPHHKVFITPFGIDENTFAPRVDWETRRDDNAISIGTVKTLSPKYGIDTLLQAFAIVGKRRSEHAAPILLEITGGGPEEGRLRALAHQLGIAAMVRFHGPVVHDRVVGKLHDLDVYVALSRSDSESFGVAILEAGACGLPVVVSDADGPAEVTVDGVTGFVVPKDDPKAAAERIEQLIQDAVLRQRMGDAGRQHVLDNYTWERSVDLMIAALHGTIEENHAHQQ